MKIKLLGNQWRLLEDTLYWVDGCAVAGCDHSNHESRPKPVNAVIDWSDAQLIQLAKYCEDRGELITWDARTEDMEDYRARWSEAKSLFALAKRIRKALGNV